MPHSASSRTLLSPPQSVPHPRSSPSPQHPLQAAEQLIVVGGRCWEGEGGVDQWGHWWAGGTGWGGGELANSGC